EPRTFFLTSPLPSSRNPAPDPPPGAGFSFAGRFAADMAGEVTYERRGAAAILTIDRPERRNAVDGPTADLLGEGFERFEADDEARVLVLTGAGDLAFCAGADLKDLQSLAPRLESPHGPLGFTRRTASKPTIAAISGWCLAGGLELALWCDLRIAAALAAFPQVTMLADRRSTIEGLGMTLDEGLAHEARAGFETYEAAQQGAARFAGGEGRGGAGAGV